MLDLGLSWITVQFLLERFNFPWNCSNRAKRASSKRSKRVALWEVQAETISSIIFWKIWRSGQLSCLCLTLGCLLGLRAVSSTTATHCLRGARRRLLRAQSVPPTSSDKRLVSTCFSGISRPHRALTRCPRAR